MNNFLISILGIVIGIFSTILVSIYFYRKNLKKSLTPYIQFYSSPFEGMDKDVKKDLQIKYQGKEINNLYEIQFLIANTGDRSIRDIIEPLTLQLPSDFEILDSSVIYVFPEGRKIDLNFNKEKNEIKFIFPLLNSGEFFITKILINGTPTVNDFKFTIIADELPPIINSEILPYDAISTSRRKKFHLIPFISGAILTLLGLSIVKVIFDSWNTLPKSEKYGFLSFIFSLNLSNWSLILSILPTFLILIFGFLLILAGFTNGRFPPRNKKFIVPNDERLLKRNRLRVFSEL